MFFTHLSKSQCFLSSGWTYPAGFHARRRLHLEAACNTGRPIGPVSASILYPYAGQCAPKSVLNILAPPSLKCINYAFRQFLLQYSPRVLILGKPHCCQGLQKGRGCVELCLENTCNDPTIFVESASQASNSNSGCKPGNIQGMLLLPCMWRSSCRGVMWLKFGSRDRCRVFLKRASVWFATCR